MKRILFIVLALGMFAASLAGCHAGVDVDKPNTASQIGSAQ